MRTKTLLFAWIVPCLLSLNGCYKDDIDDLKKQAQDHEERIAALEQWQTTVNRNISSLQELVGALESNDYVTGVAPVTEGGITTGYTISFTRSGPVTILHGKDGEDGEDGLAPQIGVRQHTDGKYYWTLNGEWLLDGEGNKFPTTGADGSDGTDGKTPKVRINPVTNYWEISARGNDDGYVSTGIKATGDKGDKGDTGAAGSTGSTGATGPKGDQGDAIFKKNGIDNSRPDYVVFTLADGVTTLTLPKAGMTIGFEGYDLFYGSSARNELTIVLPSTLKETDYKAISATITGNGGMGTDIQTRAAGSDTWKVQVTKPVFNAGALVAGSAKVTIAPPKHNKLSETALLTVTLTDKQGKDHSVSRPVKYFDGTIVESTAGGLNTVVTDPGIQKLAVTGEMNADDFSYVKSTLTNLEVLDISMTGLDEIPDRALWNQSSPNTTLKRVVLPPGLTEIGYAAFGACAGLEFIDTENTEVMGEYAFWKCENLKEIRLGDKLKIINNYAFTNCVSLTSIEIPGSVVSLGEQIFQGCGRLERIILNEGIQTLSKMVFYNCGITSITIPTTLTAIPELAFFLCENLERVNLHDGITDIEKQAFASCILLRSIKIPAGVTEVANNTFHSCRELKVVTFHSEVTSIGNDAFAFCGMEEIQLPSNLQSLGERAFLKCEKLKEISIPSTLTEIPERAFADCKSLTKADLGEGVRKIGKEAFYNSGLTGITFPKSMQSIGYQAFRSCAQLKWVTSNSTTPPTIEDNTFDTDKTGRNLSHPIGSDYESWKPYFDSFSTHTVRQ